MGQSCPGPQGGLPVRTSHRLVFRLTLDLSGDFQGVGKLVTGRVMSVIP